MKKVLILFSVTLICGFIMCDDSTSNNSTKSTLDEGLIAHFTFDNEMEIKANLEISHSGIQFVADRFGKSQSAAQFSTSSVLQANVGSNFSVSELTITAWIKQDGPGTQNPRIVAVGPTDGTPAQFYSLIFSTTSNPRPLWFYCTNGNSGTSYSLQPGPILSDAKLDQDNSWQHVAVTFQNSAVTFYVNGIKDKTVQTTGNITTFTKGLLVVGHSDYNNYDNFEGCIDDLCIYNRALTENELSQLAK